MERDDPRIAEAAVRAFNAAYDALAKDASTADGAVVVAEVVAALMTAGLTAHVAMAEQVGADVAAADVGLLNAITTGLLTMRSNVKNQGDDDDGA